jgi:hypothetical protein
MGGGLTLGETVQCRGKILQIDGGAGQALSGILQFKTLSDNMMMQLTREGLCTLSRACSMTPSCYATHGVHVSDAVWNF